MVIDDKLLDRLTEMAKSSPRLRMNYDLRDSESDGSQRMLNALEPGTSVPIHRHPDTSETVVILRGSALLHFYDECGNLTENVMLRAGTGPVALVVEMGRWSNIESLESGTVIVEFKNGPYAPPKVEDILPSSPSTDGRKC